VTSAPAACVRRDPARDPRTAADDDQPLSFERHFRSPFVSHTGSQRRKQRPTATGRAILADARAALADAERVVRTGRAVAGGGEGTLRIACAESMTAGLLAPVLRNWHRHRPGVLITLTETTSADALVAALDVGEADVAVGPRPSRWTGPAEVVGREEIVVALATDHPLATRAAVPMADLAGLPVVHYHPDNGLGGWLDEEAARNRARRGDADEAGGDGGAARGGRAGGGTGPDDGADPHVRGCAAAAEARSAPRRRHVQRDAVGFARPAVFCGRDAPRDRRTRCPAGQTLGAHSGLGPGRGRRHPVPRNSPQRPVKSW
jgi:DNA-binding transcriptional LysR family regulator